MRVILIFILLFTVFSCKEQDVRDSQSNNITKVDNIQKSDEIENFENVSKQEKETLKDTIYIDEEFLMIAAKKMKVDVIRRGEVKNIQSKGDTLFSNDYVTFLGDLDIELEIFVKYYPRYKFEDFPIDIYKGALAKPDFNSYENSKRFKTRISDGSKQRPNFAGNLNFISWGCGTNCQSGMILNSETGEIHEGLVTAWGFKSKADSRLLIENYGLFEENEDQWQPFCSFCIAEFYVWDAEKEKLIKLK